jgi:hypothetical protein
MGCDKKTDISSSTSLLILAILLLKNTHEYNKLNATEIEDILEFFCTLDDTLKTLALPEGSQRFCLILAMMGHNTQENGLKLWPTTIQTSPKKNSKTEFIASSFYLWKRTSLWTSRNG